MPEGFIARLARGFGYAVKGGDAQAWFGPQTPLAPVAPPEVAGRQFDYPFGFNQVITPRHREPTGFGELRGLADSYDLLRVVLETRKDQMERLSWRIRRRDGVANGATSDRRIATISTFFARPDRVHSWSTWLRILLEDLLVIDAPTLYLRRTRSGALWALEPLDGATIKRLIDDWGRTPAPPTPAYQQILKGVPAVDYTADELIYAPRNLRIDLVVIDAGTGAGGVIAGTPGNSPSPPSLIAGKRQIAQIAVPSGATVITSDNITDLRAVWGSASGGRGIPWAIASGAADAITASYTPATPNPIPDGYILGFRASAANATTAPSFAPDGLAAHTVTKKGGGLLLAGDIPGTSAEALIRYNAANSRWELLNPAVSLPTIPNNQLLANTSGATATPVATGVSALIDAAIGNTRGSILVRQSGGWGLIGPGSSGQVPVSNGTDIAMGPPSIGAGTVNQAALKTTSGQVSGDNGSNVVLPGGLYGFYPVLAAGGNYGISAPSFYLNDNVNLVSPYTPYIVLD